ncbi:MAG: hypothetical protein FWE12_07945 [Oscillospiraceae bacterium]|nr:hypothetical protein [Oscillospiraceae bacterium]
MQDFGKQLAAYETKRSTFAWLKIGAIAAFLLFGIGGIFLILYPIDPEDTIIGYGLLGAAVFFPLVLLFLTKRMRAQVTIYEEGVVVQSGGKEHRFHFSEIAGLRDTASGGGTIIVPGGLGVLGALAVGAASAIASSAVDARRQRNRIRSVSIVPIPRGEKSQSEISVVNTGGDALSEVFTEWLVDQKSITEDRIPTLHLSFGDSLKLVDGVLIHTHRRGETRLALQDVTQMDTDDGSLRFFGPNEKGTEKCLISIDFRSVWNLDLLFYLYELSDTQSE